MVLTHQAIQLCKKLKVAPLQRHPAKGTDPINIAASICRVVSRAGLGLKIDKMSGLIRA